MIALTFLRPALRGLRLARRAQPAPGKVAATYCNELLKEMIMKIRFLGKEPKPNDSPTLYAADQNFCIVQGYIVTNLAILCLFDLNDEETLVEVPPRLMAHLNKDALSMEILRPAPPIVHVKEDRNYIMRGRSVTRAAALSQMNIPHHETCTGFLSRASSRCSLGGKTVAAHHR
jgi:hypothetical protein